jgi:putative ABC transport system permease protein
VRVALGARAYDVVSMVVGNSLRLGAIGASIGVAVAYVAARSMEALLAGVQPADVQTFVGAVGLVIVMVLVGTLAPTLRALRVNPITAIRSE